MSTQAIKTAAIVAMSENRCIGVNNDLPWHIPGDLKRVKQITMGKPLIMGRKTYESIGKPLPGRDTLIVSRRMDKPEFENVFVHPSVNEAIQHAHELAAAKGCEEVIIFGGGQIYQQALPLTDKIYLTIVHLRIERCEAYFPEINAKEWQETEREKHTTEEGLIYEYVTLIR
jgi:dihydrofolate reductase